MRRRSKAQEINETSEKTVPEEEPANQGEMNVEQQSLPEEGQDMVTVGAVYKQKEGDAEVMPWHVDFTTARVRFSPVGIGSGREDEMRTSDFLNTYEMVEKSSLAEASAEESQAAAEKRQEEARKEAERK